MPSEGENENESDNENYVQLSEPSDLITEESATSDTAENNDDDVPPLVSEEGMSVALILKHGVGDDDGGKATQNITKEEAKKILQCISSGVRENVINNLLKACNEVRLRIGDLLRAQDAGIEDVELTEDNAFPHKQGLGTRKETRVKRARECMDDFNASWERLRSACKEVDNDVSAAVEAYYCQVNELASKLLGRGAARKQDPELELEQQVQRDQVTDAYGLSRPEQPRVDQHQAVEEKPASCTEQLRPWLLQTRGSIAAMDPNVHSWNATGPECFTLLRWLAGACEDAPLHLALASDKTSMSHEDLRKDWNSDTYDASGPIIVANAFLCLLSSLLKSEEVSPPFVGDSNEELTKEEKKLDMLDIDRYDLENARMILLDIVGVEHECAAIMNVVEVIGKRCLFTIDAMRDSLQALLNEKEAELWQRSQFCSNTEIISLKATVESIKKMLTSLGGGGETILQPDEAWGERECWLKALQRTLEEIPA